MIGRVTRFLRFVIVDAADPAALGRWWADALGWAVVDDSPEEYEIRLASDQMPGLLFIHLPEAKTVKNRLHLDFRPDDRQADVDKLPALGARHADIGQGEQSWTTLVTRRATSLRTRLAAELTGAKQGDEHTMAERRRRHRAGADR